MRDSILCLVLILKLSSIGGLNGGLYTGQPIEPMSYNYMNNPVTTSYNLQSHPVVAFGDGGSETVLQTNPLVSEASVLIPQARQRQQTTAARSLPLQQLVSEIRGQSEVTAVPVGGGNNGGKKSKFHNCYRKCSADASTRMICTFNFTIANYYVLSPPHCRQCPNVTADCGRYGCLAGDGRQRVVTVVNKLLPGPAIRTCEGDVVVVDVTNKLGGQETTIHWHGIHQQGTPWMDGVPHVTQCPIPQGTTFRYQFVTPKAGTYLWHSHDGVQRADGVAGPFVVRKAREADPQSRYYDHDLAEHEIMVWDWLSDLSILGFVRGDVTDDRELPRSILVNGKGIPPGFFDDFRRTDTLQTRGKPYVPLHELRIKQGLSYRFRLISNGVTLCPVEVSIESHSMLIIGADGFDLQPASVQSLVVNAGERFDFVVHGDQPVGSYWMKFRGLVDCNTTRKLKCNAESKRADGVDCTKTHCKCTHWINVQLNAIVEVILVDMGIRFDASHPFHLHGHAFRVVALERLGNTTDPETIREWDEEGLIPRRRKNAPIKDTVYVPDGGYTILRFRADNPGLWLFHCHVEFHSERGMALIFQVGNESHTPRPPPNFPKCGNFVPPIESSSPFNVA